LVLEPENAEAYFLLGLTHQDDARHAAELFEKAVALDPEYADAWRELALVQWRLGDLVAAEEQARKAIALDDRSAWNHDYLGVILTAAHKYEEALQELRKARELWPDSRLFYCHLGDALLRLDQDADAEAAYKRALALDVNYYLANLRMGQMRQMQGHLADARRYMERAVHAAPSNREARRVLSELPPEGEHGPEQ